MSKTDVILKVENISKQYRLGLVGTGTLSHDLNRWWSKIRGKEDPYLKVGESNDRRTKGNSEYVWALKDIDFEVQKGEVLGIIGKNGAGKSTLLKILSRVTSPSTGSIKTKGRIASLLEVGTGFHGEMTGRENIYLNGAILGMTKKEITSKIEEIIDFSGCQRYIDTPVKRYSSGMTVRLAFAVAAFLEPDILVVDEVLAVGDAEFQKKAIGKMQDISKSDGRTVLFVSHNMESIQKLCSRCLVLSDGEISFEGNVLDAVNRYLEIFGFSTGSLNFPIIGKGIEITKFQIKDSGENVVNHLILGQKYFFEIGILNKDIIKEINIRLQIFDFNDNLISTLNTFHTEKHFKAQSNQYLNVECIIAKLPYAPGSYKIGLQIMDLAKRINLYENNSITEFFIENGDFYGSGKLPGAKNMGKVLTNYEWIIDANGIS
ncbi:ABC transporter ATP-binding protein [Winogradskyella ursingii]|uniref:ABC transporter ATP-binding protein n=1 Tax=Winogradskyella ursingii TaxID=2686079 RepID=UPI0015CD6371|nr:ABC transporter ATP-binding protein [Winogradskyella ursingii]